MFDWIMQIFERIARRNFLLLIQVRAKGLRFPIIIPVPLDLVEDIIESSLQLVRLFSWFVPGLRRVTHKARRIGSFNMGVSDFLELSTELFRELKRSGRITLVEVNDDGAHVSIKLY